VPGDGGTAAAFTASPPLGVPAVAPVSMPRVFDDDTAVVASVPLPPSAAGKGVRRGGPLALIGGARRNLVAAGAGVLLAGVLGTVVTLGLTSNSDPQGDAGTTTEQEVPDDEGVYDDEVTAGDPTTASPSGSGSGSASPTPSVSGSASPGVSSSVTPSSSSDGPSSPDTPSSPGATESSVTPSKPTPTKPKPTSTKSTPTETESGSPSPTETDSPDPTESETPDPPTVPDTSDSAVEGSPSGDGA
ncbi:ATP-binding protein, partial [Streptomyces sp. SID9124]|nr:ATP-binding protein [Streptomyces sp. SID9124]